jgi:hypothetical protein
VSTAHIELRLFETTNSVAKEINMSVQARNLVGALLMGSLVAASALSSALAASQDYRFELAQKQVKAGNDAQLAVRLIHVPSGKAVENAVIFQTRLDMSPMGMADMTSRATPVKADEPGLYKFRAPLSMEGDWSLQLSAKVPGETDTISGKVQFKAAK